LGGFAGDLTTADFELRSVSHALCFDKLVRFLCQQLIFAPNEFCLLIILFSFGGGGGFWILVAIQHSHHHLCDLLDTGDIHCTVRKMVETYEAGWSVFFFFQMVLFSGLSV
jgi:hypothetical protein